MAKIGDVSNIDAVQDADEFAIADASASTSDVSATALQIKTYVNTAPTFAAGSASAGTWPKLTAGTLMTTAEDGAIEMDADCLYGCTDAGNRGYIPIRHFIRADSQGTLTSTTSSQAIFKSPTNGRITLETGTYLFEGLIVFASMSGTTGNAQINLLGAGTATAGTWMWMLQGIDAATVGTLVDLDSPVFQTSTTAASAVTAGTGVTLRLWVKGSVEITAAGTFIPSVALVTAASATIEAGSYFMIERIGSTTVVSRGQWD